MSLRLTKVGYVGAGLGALVAAIALFPNLQTVRNKASAMRFDTKLSIRLQHLFEKPKLVCFGRYALAVPQEAEVIWGSLHLPSDVSVFKGGMDAVKQRAAEDVAKLKYEDRTAEITYNDVGPVEGSWQVRYFQDDAAKALNLHFFNTYVNKGKLFFLLGGEIDDGQTEEQALSREAIRARTLRLRREDEVPTDPGYCIEHAFLPSSIYDKQEIVNVGIRFPSLPDVTFSVSSNKDAYGDYSKAEFEKMKAEKLSLLARVRAAQEEQGPLYPHRTLLREGRHEVLHWNGEESLIRRPDGVHDFEWAMVGTPRDVANPGELIVNLYTKVEHDTVGAAATASLNDDEAVALWDKLLSGLKFRVKVPGAPQGSYYLPTTNPMVGDAK